MCRKKCFKFLSRDYCEFGEERIAIGWDILWLTIKNFTFRWFTDCGEWFIYLEHEKDGTTKYVRFSSAGYMKGSYRSW